MYIRPVLVLIWGSSGWNVRREELRLRRDTNTVVRPNFPDHTRLSFGLWPTCMSKVMYVHQFFFLFVKITLEHFFPGMTLFRLETLSMSWGLIRYVWLPIEHPRARRVRNLPIYVKDSTVQGILVIDDVDIFGRPSTRSETKDPERIRTWVTGTEVEKGSWDVGDGEGRLRRRTEDKTNQLWSPRVSHQTRGDH